MGRSSIENGKYAVTSHRQTCRRMNTAYQSHLEREPMLLQEAAGMQIAATSCLAPCTLQAQDCLGRLSPLIWGSEGEVMQPVLCLVRYQGNRRHRWIRGYMYPALLFLAPGLRSPYHSSWFASLRAALCCGPLCDADECHSFGARLKERFLGTAGNPVKSKTVAPKSH